MSAATIQRHLGNAIFALTVTMILPMTAAHAYLDAGSISMALQVTIGAIASGLMIAKLYLHRILAFFGLRKTAKNEAADD